MPQIVPRSSQKDKVNSESLHGMPALHPSFQVHETDGKEEYTTLPITPTLNGNSFQDSSREILFDLEPNDCGEIKDIELRFTVSSTTGMTLVPSAYLIKRIIVESNKSMGDEIARVYPLNIQLYQYLNSSPTEICANSKTQLYQLQNYGCGQKQRYTHGENSVLNAGERRDIYLPIPVNVFQMGAVDMSFISQALRFRIQLNNDIDAVNGGSGDLQLENLHFMIRSVRKNDADEEFDQKVASKNHHSYVYLDCDRLVVNDKNVQAGVVNRYPLDHFVV